MESLIERAIRLEKEGIFLGGPAKLFKTAGRKQLTTLLSEGLTPASKVLDIGCGNGDFANKILDRVDQVFCVDTSQEYINICKTRFSNSKNINVLKLGKDYTDLSFIKNIKLNNNPITNGICKIVIVGERAVSMTTATPKKMLLNKQVFV